MRPAPYLTRTEKRFDLIQMSMVDTWAATGAGAFTLYRRTGCIRSRAGRRCSAPSSRTGSLQFLAGEQSIDLPKPAASFLGDSNPPGPGDRASRIAPVLVGRKKVATLIFSLRPFSPQEELDTISAVAAAEGFHLMVVPGSEDGDALLRTLSRCQSLEELETKVAHALYDQRPPVDERPFFFNILTLRGVVEAFKFGGSLGVIGTGNLIASMTLVLLWIIVVGCLIEFGPRSSASDRPSPNERTGFRILCRLLRPHRRRIHVCTDSAVAAILDFSGSPDLRSRNHPVFQVTLVRGSPECPPIGCRMNGCDALLVLPGLHVAAVHLAATSSLQP